MTTAFSQEHLSVFLHTFDSSRLKYFGHLPDPENSYNLLDGATPGFELLERIRKFESDYQQNTLVRRNYGEITARQLLVFGNSRTVSDNTAIFELVRKKMLEEYLAIPNLEKLYSERYFDFEWDMLVGRNFAAVSHDYYRDHFIHQVRNLFMMLELLKHQGFYQAVERALGEHGQTPTSRYFCQMRNRCVNQILAAPNSEQYQLVTSARTNNFLSPREAIQEYVTRYAIYGATVMAALFHDIGYPIRHYLSLRSRLADYIPSLYMLGLGSNASFERLFSILDSSLLLHIVDPSEVRTRLQVNEKGDYDHGAYSAVTFLAALYDNGSIFDLSGEQRLAVELAAVMIYDHTGKYKKSDEADEPRAWDYQALFHIAPLSYLFRVCDDLQEWDRIYYEISDFGEMTLCPRCGMPIVHRPDNEGNVRSVCGCPEPPAYTMLNSHISDARVIYSVNTCAKVSVERQGFGGLFCKLDYDLEKLLHMSVISSIYAKHRISEMNKLKQYMEGQTIDGIPDFKLSYFLSSNPIAIKIAIMHRLYESNPNFNRQQILRKLENHPAPYNLASLTYVFPPEIQILIPSVTTTRSQFENLYFYLFCALYISNMADCEDVAHDAAHGQFFAPAISALFDSIHPQNEPEKRILLEDAFRSFHSYLRTRESADNQRSKDYLTQYKSSDHTLHLIDFYCNPQYAYSDFALDYYSDLNCFHKIWELCK